MSDDAWPVPESLPLLEELSVSGDGYHRDDARLAFDAFYRHSAQLDALHARRAPPEQAWTVPRYEVPPRGVSGVVLRFAAETALIVSVAVIAGVYRFHPIVTVALMAAAFLITALSEWLASKSSFVPPVFAFLPPPGEREQPELVEALTIVATPREDGVFH
jgi:hypothetical protein